MDEGTARRQAEADGADREAGDMPGELALRRALQEEVLHLRERVRDLEAELESAKDFSTGR